MLCVCFEVTGQEEGVARGQRRRRKRGPSVSDADAETRSIILFTFNYA